MVALAAVGLLAALAGPAAAAPLEPTMTQARLVELLDDSPTGTVDGYFKTVVRGDDIVSIPCTIQGIVPQAAYDNGDLILFQATGAVIEEIQGIAAGMSGSPVYVSDGGDDLLVGAVSYGDIFTDNGLGLATPIEHMMELETDFDIDPLATRVAKTVTLAAPVRIGGATIKRVAVAPTTRAARQARAGESTLVMRSLSILMVGGIPTDTAAFRLMKADMAAQGIEVRGVSGGAAGAMPEFETALVPGSSVGMLFMRGDYWYGGVGTTTYTTDDDYLVAFGHPMMYDGSLSAFMTNANVVGVWANGYEPYKVVAPGKVRGTITVDSGAGIAGVIGDTPAEVPFTCTVTNSANGKSVSRTSVVTQFAADQFKYPYWDLNAYSFYPALYQAAGDQQYDGHLEYTLTIEVTNGVDDATITRHNVWEDSYGFDAPFLAVVELASMLTTLTDDRDGAVGMHLKSVTLEATLSPQHDRARIVDVNVLGGLRVGANTVQVSMYEYGETAPTVVDVPLTIPAGTKLTGTLYAKAPFTNVESMGDGSYGWYTEYSENVAPPQSMDDVVSELNDFNGNNLLLVAYDPPLSSDDYDDYDDWGMGEPWSDNAVVASADLDKYLTGEVEKRSAHVTLSTQKVGPWLDVRGTVDADGAKLSGETVSIYSREAGEPADTLVGEPRIRVFTRYFDDEYEYSVNRYSALLDSSVHTTRYSAVWAGNDEYFATRVSKTVAVRAEVSLAAVHTSGRTIRAVATLTPADTGGKVTFVRVRRDGTTRHLTTVAVSPGGKAVATFAGSSGVNRIRAYFQGSGLNTAAKSGVKSVTLP